MYAHWWNTPQDVDEPVIIDLSEYEAYRKIIKYHESHADGFVRESVK